MVKRASTTVTHVTKKENARTCKQATSTTTNNSTSPQPPLGGQTILVTTYSIFNRRPGELIIVFRTISLPRSTDSHEMLAVLEL